MEHIFFKSLILAIRHFMNIVSVNPTMQSRETFTLMRSSAILFASLGKTIFLERLVFMNYINFARKRKSLSRQ